MRKPYREPYACLKQPVKPAGVCLRFAFDAFLADLASGAFFADQLAYLKLDTVTPQDLVLVFRAYFFPPSKDEARIAGKFSNSGG